MSDWLTNKIDCTDACEVPPGKMLARVPPPRHAWSDVIRCPNCGDCFLVRPADEEATTALSSGERKGGSNE